VSGRLVGAATRLSAGDAMMLSKFEIVTLFVAMGICLLLATCSARQLSSTILLFGADDDYAQHSRNACVNSSTGLHNPTISLHGEPRPLGTGRTMRDCHA
jgi:hypothetical protein